MLYVCAFNVLFQRRDRREEIIVRRAARHSCIFTLNATTTSQPPGIREDQFVRSTKCLVSIVSVFGFICMLWSFVYLKNKVTFNIYSCKRVDPHICILIYIIIHTLFVNTNTQMTITYEDLMQSYRAHMHHVLTTFYKQDFNGAFCLSKHTYTHTHVLTQDDFRWYASCICIILCAVLVYITFVLHGECLRDEGEIDDALRVRLLFYFRPLHKDHHPTHTGTQSRAHTLKHTFTIPL